MGDLLACQQSATMRVCLWLTCAWLWCGALAPSGYLWFGAHFLACATGAVARAKREDEGRRSV